MNIEYAEDEEGYRSYYTREDVNESAFRDELRRHVEDNDPILKAPVKRVWKRIARDFDAQCTIIIDAVASTRGAFLATWVEDYPSSSRPEKRRPSPDAERNKYQIQPSPEMGEALAEALEASFDVVELQEQSDE